MLYFVRNDNCVKNDDYPALPKMHASTEKHGLLIEKENEVFDNTSWNDIIGKDVSNKLKNILVKKSVLSKNGAGYLLFPDSESQKKAEHVLKDDFTVTLTTKKGKRLLPKIKLFDVFEVRSTN